MTDVQAPATPGSPTRATRQRLTAILASRICHDLVGPLGAIANGLELMAMSGETTPESELVAESAALATARLRLFRLAYGIAGAEQMTGRAEVRAILRDVSHGGRLELDWDPSGEWPREEVRAVLILLQCFETAMPVGGRIQVTREGRTWVVTGEGPSLRVDEALWRSLHPGGARAPEAPAQVHFTLLPDLLLDLDRVLSVDVGPRRMVARF